jgi:transcriptional regulator with XRE-family HTH domain
MTHNDIQYNTVRYNAQLFYEKKLDNLTVKISTTLKMLRSQLNWSLETASKKTGVSKAMLGQIERGESNPTIATLWKIASGFNVSFSLFIDDPQSNKTNLLHRKQKLQQVHQRDSKINVMSIFPYDEKLKFEIFMIELLPQCTHLSPPHQLGVTEHVIPLTGTIEVLIDEVWHKVNQYEGLRFSADQSHGYRNVSNKPALFHNIIHYDKQ